MAMAVPTKRLCGVVSSGGTSTVMHGELSPCRDFAISAKPGGGFHWWAMGLSGGVSALWLGVVSKLTAGVVAMGFDLPILWAAMKEPLVWALLFWLWLHSWGMVVPQVLWADQDHLQIHCHCKASPPWHKNSWTMGQVWMGMPNPPAWAVTSQSDHPMPSHLPRTVARNHQPQHSDCHQM